MPPSGDFSLTSDYVQEMQEINASAKSPSISSQSTLTVIIFKLHYIFLPNTAHHLLNTDKLEKINFKWQTEFRGPLQFAPISNISQQYLELSIISRYSFQNPGLYKYNKDFIAGRFSSLSFSLRLPRSALFRLRSLDPREQLKD